MTATMPASRRRRTAGVPSPTPEWAYFVDLDGTLLDIAPRPGDVQVDAELRATITALTTLTGGAVAIITGRPVAEVDQLFPALHLPVAGQHGLERRAPNGHVTRCSPPLPALDLARTRLRDVVQRHPGLLLEDKGLSLALHYRQALALASYAHRVMRQVGDVAGAEFCVQRGKRVVELKLAGRDKGTAIRTFLTEAPFRGRRPVFIGDDMTDEYGFAVINELDGISVKVGPGRTTAGWRMRDVRAVRRWLSQAVAASAGGAVPS
ncbi:MAG: trehalose-phosphatase [Gemmatimonadaceae bacterium]|nr:trehalose-phosphatase [Gemmatimonadaceae bacterium]